MIGARSPGGKAEHELVHAVGVAIDRVGVERQHRVGQGRAHRFNQHADGAAAGQPHGKGGFVADAEGQKAALPIGQRRLGLGHHRALDAAARD